MKKIKLFYGVDISAFKKQMKEDAKQNNNKIGWYESDNDLYYCNGYFIIKFDNMRFTEAAACFGLTFADAPEKYRELDKIFHSFDGVKYAPATETKWTKKAANGMTLDLIVTNEAGCFIQSKYMQLFPCSAVNMATDPNKGIRLSDGIMTAYVLPVRATDQDLAIIPAMITNILGENV